MAVVLLRIVVLHIDSGVWCEFCAATSAITVTYVEEHGDRVPDVMYRLTYCPTCESR